MYTLPLAPGLDVSLAGAKAANLGRALGLGLKVPPGLVVTREALRLFLAETGLAGQVHDYLQGSRLHDRAARRQSFAGLSVAVLAAPMPPALQEEVSMQAAPLLAAAPAGLAVRSSAAQEDSAAASFAGMYESVLGITSLSGLWEGIRRCWCSSWAPRVLDYAARLGIDLAPDTMAILIQQLVPAESAGVLFTADPLTGNPWRFVLNATFGLAQGLVAGQAPADRWALQWDTAEILERDIAVKGTVLEAAAGSVHAVALPAERRHAPSLSDDEVRRLGQMALGLDRAWDERVDIEWALAAGEPYLVQVRPITALPSFFPHHLEGDDAQLTWTLADGYGSYEPGKRLLAPLGRCDWMTEMWLRYAPPPMEGQPWPRAAWRERDFNGFRYTTPQAWDVGTPNLERTEAWLDEHEARLRRDWTERTAGLLQESERVAQVQRQARSARDLLPTLLSFRALENDYHAAVWAAPQWLGFTCEALLRNLLRGSAPDFPLDSVLRGWPCYSLERTAAAQDLGRSITEPAVRAAFAREPLAQVIPHLLAQHPGCRFLADYERFCWRFGMRPPSLAEPWAGWAQNPAPVLAVIRSAALGQARELQPVLEAVARERAASEGELRARVQGADPALVPRLDKLLAWACFWVPALDDRKWGLTGSLRLADLLRQTGELLVAEGVLDEARQIRLLTVADLGLIAAGATACHARELFLQRRREYEANRRLQPPAYLGAPPAAAAEVEVAAAPAGLEDDHAAPAAGHVLHGEGLAPGCVTGVARQALDAADPAFLDSLRGEHIIVCGGKQSWETDWLSLLVIARGLVTVRGAALHHAVQIARECGAAYVNLPAESLERIPDGARIALDGAAGTVTILPGA